MKSTHNSRWNSKVFEILCSNCHGTTSFQLIFWIVQHSSAEKTRIFVNPPVASPAITSLPVASTMGWSCGQKTWRTHRRRWWWMAMVDGNGGCGGFPGSYPLVNIQKTMENHHFQWENPLFLWSFSIAMLNYQRVGRWKLWNREKRYVKSEKQYVARVKCVG